MSWAPRGGARDCGAARACALPTRLSALLSLLFVLLVVGVPFARAETKPPAADDAPLVVHKREIFVFRTVLSGYTPEERAQTAQRRLQRILARGLHLTV